MMADTNDIAAGDGQSIVTTKNTIVGPGPPQVSADAISDDGGGLNSDENMKNDNASAWTFQYPQAVQGTRLLTIPPEIRNMIFKLCLYHPEDIGEKLKLKKKVECFTVTSNYFSGVARPKLEEAYEHSIAKRTKKTIKKHSFRNLALLRTCQFIYNDAARVFWGQRLTFRNILQLQNFLLAPNVRHDLVRDVRVLNLDHNTGISYMPAICALVADKMKGLEVFDVDQGHMRREAFIRAHDIQGFRHDEHIKTAAKNLGFGIYSCMHPWVTKVVCEQGIDKLMAILRIVRETNPIGKNGPKDGNPRVYWDFRGRGPLTAEQRVMADTATAEEILRLIDVYERKL